MLRLLDLKKQCGLPVQFDGKDLILNEFTAAQVTETKIEDLKSQLLNDEISSQEVFCKKYIQLDDSELFQSRKLRFNLYIIHPLLAGVEYSKTKSVKIKHHPKILEVVTGGGILMMQKTAGEEVKDLIMCKVKKGDKVIVPPNYALSIINTRQSSLIVSELYCEEARHTHVLDDMGGMAYYIIKKNGKQEIVMNSYYKQSPKPRSVKWEEINRKLNITSKTPIIKQALRKYEKFSWLFKTDQLPPI